MFGLDPDTIRNIKKAFSKFPEIEKVLIYGSRAKGNYKKGSDIDITLIGKKLTIDNSVYPLMDKLDELYLPYTFDISIFNKIDNPDLIEHVLRVGKTFYQKKSGLPDGWEVKKLERCLEKTVYTKKVKRKSFLQNGEYPIISQEQEFINGYWNNSNDLFEVKKPVVIFGDHTQVVKYIDFSFVLGADGVKILQPKNEIEPKYFYYFLLNVNLGSLGYARHYRLLKELEIHYPKLLPEQKRIVAILDKAFTAIDKAKANAEKNLANAKELFESYLNGIFENPRKDWKEKKLGEVYDVRDGTHDSPKYHDSGYPLITSKNLKHDEIVYNKIKYISKTDYLNINKRSEVNVSDVLFAMIGTIGNPVVVTKQPDYAIKNVALFKVSSSQSSWFLKYYLGSKFVTNKMTKEAKGTTQKFVGLGYLRSFSIIFPALPEQKNIVSKLNVLSTETKRLEKIYQQKIDDLEELKKTILQKAFEGEL